MWSFAAITRVASIGLVLLAIGGMSRAETYSAGNLVISNPWARATPGGATVGAGYLSITNKGSEPDKLIGGSLAPAARFQVHVTVMENGIAKMRPVQGLEIRPGETIEFKPGGMHVMFMGLKQPLKQGQMLKGTLVFEKAGTVAVEFSVQGIGASAPSDGHRGH